MEVSEFAKIAILKEFIQKSESTNIPDGQAEVIAKLLIANELIDEDALVTME